LSQTGSKDLAGFFQEIQETQEQLQKRIGNLETKLKTFEEQQEKPYGYPYGAAFFRAVLRFINRMKPKDLDDLKKRLQQLAGQGEKIDFSDFENWTLITLPTGEQARFIAAKDEADCKAKGGTWKAGRCFIVEGEGEILGGEKAYPAPLIAKLLAYLTRQEGTEWNKRKTSYVKRLLGARGEELPTLTEEEKERLFKDAEEFEKAPMEGVVLKETGEAEPIVFLPTSKETGEEEDKIGETWLTHGLEHQLKEEKQNE